MSRLRVALVGAGVVALGLGVATVVEPGLAGLIVTSQFYVPLLGMLALLQGYRVIRRRRASEIRGSETPDSEIIVPTDAPGVTFDQRLASVAGYRRATVRTRQQIQERLREVAAATLQQRENCSQEAALARIDDGTWTDDPFAAAFLGDRTVSSPPLWLRLRHALASESRFQRNARRTVDAIANLEGERA